MAAVAKQQWRQRHLTGWIDNSHKVVEQITAAPPSWNTEALRAVSHNGRKGALAGQRSRRGRRAAGTKQPTEEEHRRAIAIWHTARQLKAQAEARERKRRDARTSKRQHCKEFKIECTRMLRECARLRAQIKSNAVSTVAAIGGGSGTLKP